MLMSQLSMFATHFASLIVAKVFESGITNVTEKKEKITQKHKQTHAIGIGGEKRRRLELIYVCDIGR